jgi:uncharacterized membrane protein YdbT with pleckstrin-like domain
MIPSGSVPNPPTPAEERLIFDVQPAARAFPARIFWGLVLLPIGIGLLLLLGVWYRTAATRYRLTTQRLFSRTGLIAKHEEEIELFRIKDVTLSQGMLQRLLGVGCVVVLSTDDTTPRLELAGLPDPEGRKEQIRAAFRTARQREGLRTGEFIPS